MTTRRGRLRARIARGLRRFLSTYPGVDVDQMFAEAGIDAATLDDPEGWIDFAASVALLDLAARATRDPAFCVAYAARLPWADIGVLAHVVLNSPTLGAALVHACRYYAMNSTAARPTLDVEGDAAALRHHVFDARVTAHPHNSELVLAVFTRVAREGLRQPGWTPREVRFRHAAPADPVPYDDYFAAPVRWGQRDDALVLSAADLRATLPAADDALLPVLLRHAEDLRARMPASDDLPSEVRRAIADALTGGDVTIDDVAARLDTSGRSLQRRLHEHGASFAALVADTRLALARRYLEDASLSLTEVAYLLGYAELSAFSRAFRRWTGRSAQAYRRDPTGSSS